MKVTALLPENLIDDVKALSKGKNITESLLIALNEWVQHKKIKALVQNIAEEPLRFAEDFDIYETRNNNRT